jgi:predicted phosphatase
MVTSGSKWLGYWGKHLTVDKYRLYEPFQKVNHFPLSFEIGRKDKLFKNYREIAKRFDKSVF